MLLYYFTSSRYGLAAIRDDRLKVSRFSELNDPSDNLGISVTGIMNKLTLMQQRDKFNTQGGIICMSKNWREPLLWGHYAENYHGTCLVFEADDEWWFDVAYIKEKPTVETFGKKSFSELTERDLMALGLMKSERWVYEAERRRFVEFTDYDFVDNIYFKKFDKAMQLKAVLFGFRSKVTDLQIEKILEFNKDIKLGFTRNSEKYFHIILDQTERNLRIPLERRIRYNDKKQLVL
ncbi:hypothetical protein RMR21_009665 [Agrobacterium sp. rho-8.1]|nr:hypothetical protein [Agrobacterium sp. rho-8.1]